MENRTFRLDIEYGKRFKMNDFRIFRSETTNNLYAFENEELLKMHYINGEWAIDRSRVYGLEDFELRKVFPVGVGKDLLVFTNAIGIIQIYSLISGAELYKVPQNCEFSDDLSIKEIAFGRFSNNASAIGFMVTKSNFESAFYELVEDNCKSILFTQLGLQKFCPQPIKLEIVSHLRKQQVKDTILCWTEVGVNLFEFGGRGLLDWIMSIPLNGENKFFFPSLTQNDDWNDVVIFNTTGLFVFQLGQEGGLTPINYNPMFSSAKGWSTEHTATVQFADVNDDGNDELLFTGPNGLNILSFNVYSNKWRSLLNTEMLKPHERYATILYAQPKIQGYTENPMTILNLTNHLLVGNLIENEAETIRLPAMNENFQFDLLPPIGNIKTIEANATRSTIFLRDLDIWTKQWNWVNVKTGKPSFVLPLVDPIDASATIDFNLFYDGGNNVNKYLTDGWSVQETYIIELFEPSDFEEDRIFFYFLDSVPHKLKFSRELSDSEYNIYLLDSSRKPNDQNIRVKRDNLGFNWEAEIGADRKQYFVGGAFNSDYFCRHFRARCIDDDLTERLFISYLNSEQIANVTRTFEYERFLIDHQSVVYLTKISDQSSEIEFSYKRRYDDYDMETLSGSLLVNPLYLVGYEYRTKTKEQKVRFNYSLIGNSLVLTTIEQISDCFASETVMQFSYAKQRNEKFALQKILLPTGVEIIYEYKRELGELRPITELRSKTFPIPDAYNVSYGPDFILISYLEDNDVVLRMFSNDLSEEWYSSKQRSYPTKGVWPLLRLESDDVKLFEVFLTKSFLAVVLYSSEVSVTFVFGQLADGSWQTKSTSYRNSKSAAILKGNDFLLISDPSSWVTLLEWSSTEGKWTYTELLQSNRGLMSAAVSGNHFVLYNDDYLYNGFKPFGSDKFQLKRLKYIPFFLNRTRNLLANLLGNEASTFPFFRSNSLQMFQNLIVLSELVVVNNGTQLATNIRTFLIDGYHDFVSEQTITIEQDMYEDFQLNSLEWKNYLIQLVGAKFSCRNVTYFFGGAKWHRFQNDNEKMNYNYSLGNEYVLRKSNNVSTIKLYEKRGDRFVFDLGVQSSHELRINYPHYIAAQGAQGEPIKLIQFNSAAAGGAAVTSVTLPATQTLTVFGNVDTLVVCDTNSQGERNLIIWTQIAVDKFLTVNNLVESLTVVIPEAVPPQRVTGYGYNASSLRLLTNYIAYDQTFVYPGNDPAKYGYISYNGELVEFFNDANELVDFKENKSNDEESEDQHETNEIYFDESGMLEIADFGPLNATSGAVAFAGFEDYEVANVNWNVVRGKFSLTGRNYLHLDVKPMRAIFIPEIQDQQFVVSSWIRIALENLPKPGDIVAHLTAIVFTEAGQEVANFLADVKYRIENWSYLEVIVDLQFIRFVLRGDDPEVEPNKLIIELRFSPSAQVPIDVDSLRFSPLNHIFEVNVYDINLSQPVAIIKSSGAIERHFYDEYGVRVAEINESNQIREFVSYTKGSQKAFGDPTNPRCLIKLIPEMGFYENFSPISFAAHWSLEDYEAWSVSPGALHHHSKRDDSLSLRNVGIDQHSCGIRFLYSLENDSSLAVSNLIELERNIFGGKLSFVNHFEMYKRRIPIEGELLIVKEEERVFVWIDGDLYFDRQTVPLKAFDISMRGEVRLQHLMVFSRPQVHVTYKNALGEEIQQISLTSRDSVVVKELLYDELGRQRITVQPVEVTRMADESILSYAADLVTNDDPRKVNSVWKTGELEGEISRILGHPFGFSEIVFENNPLNVKSRVGMPGEVFSSSGKYAQRFNSTTGNSFLLEKYPPRRNFTYHVQSKMSFDEISIYDKRNHKVASYIDVEGSRDLFSTFEYNENGFLTKSLPPMYYDESGSFDKITHDLTYVPKFNELEEQRWATCFSYDDGGHLIRKTTPDTGPIENVYDGNQLRFTIQYSRENPSEIEAATFFVYDEFGRLVSRGRLRKPFASNQWLKWTISEATAEEYQRFHPSDLERDTDFRGRVLRTITKSQNEELFEESILDGESNVISKRYLIPTGSAQPMMLSINQRFREGQLREILYPASMFGEPFRVAYQYDKLGRMVSVGVPGQPERFLAITYNANDQVLSETFSPLRQHGFRRSFTYNEPGFLVEIDDPFLREELSYTDKGYGKHGYADGTVSRTKYTAKWHNAASRDGLGVRSHQLSPLCYEGLQSQGYLDDNDQQTRVFYQDLEFKLPSGCTQEAESQRIKRVLGKYGFPKEYGFRFEYGNLMELTKAKYFVGNISQESRPLLHDTFFEEIQNVDMEASQNIWRILLKWGYVFSKHGHGEVQKLLLDEILALPDLRSHEFAAIFENSTLIPEIVRVLQKHSATELGQAEFDVQSYEIDANGNHKRFFAGFEHYQLKYEPNSNRVAEVRHHNFADANDANDAKVFKMRHDSRGNVVQALHKNIESMEYHPVSNRLEKVTMSDGTTVTFGYDARGERVRKRVTDKNGLKTKETHYLRDENGRSVVERQLSFMAPHQSPDVLVTMYIYGPDSLIGFVRRDQFYSVISDHLGSVRLVVRDGEVVAAYDYMPYGNLMRIYGSNPDAHISYRFTGQEWDPEIRLYNYHARFYDPVIGRFYQMDPSSQYFSPYKYAGNSPVSMVDPSGKFAILPIIFYLAVAGSALLGAYLAGAAANNNFNPLEWKRDLKTAISVILGAVSGAFFPFTLSGLTSFGSLAVAMSLGIFTAYMGAASLNCEWDPRLWDYNSPKTYNAIFQGFTAGAGIVSNFPKIWSTFRKLSIRNKYAFGGSSVGFGATNVVAAAAKAEGDLTAPDFWYSTMIGIFSATDYPMKVTGAINVYKKNKERIFESLRALKNGLRDIRHLRLSKTVAKVVIGTAGYAIYLTMVALVNTDLLPWCSTNAATMHNYLQMFIFAGFVLKNMKKHRQMKMDKPIVNIEMIDMKRNLRTVFQQTINYETMRYRRSIGVESINITTFKSEFRNVTLVLTLNRFLNPCFVLQSSQHDPELIESIPIGIRKVDTEIVNHFVGGIWFAKSIVNQISYERTLSQLIYNITEDYIEHLILQIRNVDRDRIESDIMRMDLETRESLQIKEKYQIIESELLNIPNLLEKNVLEKFVKSLKTKEYNFITNTRNIIVDVIWRNLKPLQASINSWGLKAFVDYQTPQIRTIDLPPPNPFDCLDNFHYLSTDKLGDIPDFLNVQKCSTCIAAVPKTRNKIIDIEWLKLLNNFPQSEHFLMPTSVIGINKNEKTTKRNKRNILESETGSLKQRKHQSWFHKLTNLFRGNSSEIPRLSSSHLTVPADNVPDSKETLNILEMCDTYFHHVANNGTLMLAEVLLAKCFKRKMYNSSESNAIANGLQFSKVHCIACEIIEIFEKRIMKLADEWNIPEDQLDMSFIPELYQEIIHVANKKRFDEISHLMKTYSMKAFQSSTTSLSAERREQFGFEFGTTIDEIIFNWNRLEESEQIKLGKF